MKTLKVLIAFVMATTLVSCHFDINLGQEDGNGNVVTENRPVTENFDHVKGSAGIDVFLTEGSENKVVVEADENLMDIIETEIHNGKLTIRTSNNKSIGRSKAKKVHVTYVVLKSISASSGADVIANSIVKNETITLDASSGADLEVEVFAKEVYAETSSGADMKVSGKASKLVADASSGSDLNAKNLLVLTCNADASSGADITVNVKDSLKAEASSGGDVNYYGDPAAVTNNGSRSGSVRKM
jgi:hypothetical protein